MLAINDSGQELHVPERGGKRGYDRLPSNEGKIHVCTQNLSVVVV